MHIPLRFPLCVSNISDSGVNQLTQKPLPQKPGSTRAWQTSDWSLICCWMVKRDVDASHSGLTFWMKAWKQNAKLALVCSICMFAIRHTFRKHQKNAFEFFQDATTCEFGHCGSQDANFLMFLWICMWYALWIEMLNQSTDTFIPNLRVF